SSRREPRQGQLDGAVRKDLNSAEYRVATDDVGDEQEVRVRVRPRHAGHQQNNEQADESLRRHLLGEKGGANEGPAAGAPVPNAERASIGTAPAPHNGDIRGPMMNRKHHMQQTTAGGK